MNNKQLIQLGLASLFSFSGLTYSLEAEPASQLLSMKHRPLGPTIKVMIQQDVEGALVEVKGSYNVYDPGTGKKLETCFAPSSYYMHPTTDGLKWGAEFPDMFQLLIVPDSPKTTILVQGIEYHGMVYAYQADGAIGFVNEVTLDDYTRSIVGTLCQGQDLDVQRTEADAPHS